MAHSNIDDRRVEVKSMLDDGFSHKEIKKLLSVKYNCHYSAIHADIVHFNTRGLKHSIHANKSLKERIFKRDGIVCMYCNDTSAHEYIIEHIIPAYLGGVAKEYNLVVACQKCNTIKRRTVWIPKNVSHITSQNASWYEKILSLAVKDCRDEQI